MTGSESGRRDSALRFTLLCVGYLLLWMTPRWSALAANPLLLDDFFLAVPHPDLLVQWDLEPRFRDFRWTSSLLWMLWLDILPTAVFLSVVPKLLAGILLSVTAAMLANVFVRWGVPTVVAIVVPALFLSHPAVNEVTLWNTCVALGLFFMGYVGVFMLLDREDHPSRSRMACAITIAVVFVLAYEIYLVVLLVLMLSGLTARVVTGVPIPWVRLKRQSLVFVGISAFYIAQVKLSVLLVDTGNWRGFESPPTNLHEFLLTKLQGVTNLVVNSYMPLVAFYGGLEAGYRHWELIPLGIGTCGLLLTLARGRSLVLAVSLLAFALLLPVVPALPTFVIAQTPESWRVSLPSVLAACLTLIPPLSLMVTRGATNTGSSTSRGALAVLLMAALGLAAMLPATAWEARLRVAANEADHAVVQAVRAHWQRHGAADAFKVGVLDAGVMTQHPIVEASPVLTRAYTPVRPSSAFHKDYSWRGFLQLAGVPPVELEIRDGSVFSDVLVSGCARRPELCRLDLGATLRGHCLTRPAQVFPSIGVSVVHATDAPISAVCR